LSNLKVYLSSKFAKSQSFSMLTQIIKSLYYALL
jgi:hypothetical protein